MRWVAIGSLHNAFRRAQRLRNAGAQPRELAVKQRRDVKSMEPAGGDPGTMKCRLAAMNLGLARPRFALSALAWMGDPVRTAGNEGVPL